MENKTKGLKNEAQSTGLRLFYKSNISNLTEVNPSFDSGVMRIAYVGLNRNNSIISKSVFKNNIQTLFNCPIVAHYHMAKTLEEDKLGGHDIAFIERDGELQKINMTSPLGIVPESAKYWFEQKEEDGVIHDYLCCDVLIWKRQPVYQYIKNHKGNINESMEIEVTNGYLDDNGHYKINEFYFTALCLLDDDIEPCFESASMSANFSKLSFDVQYNKMIEELSKNNKISKEGGEKMGQTIDTNETQELECELIDENHTVDGNIESTPESEQHSEEFSSTVESGETYDNENFSKETEAEATETTEHDFQLLRQMSEKLSTYFRGFKRIMDHVAGYEMSKYVFIDYDANAKTVYFEEYTEAESKEQRGFYVLYGAPCSVEDEKVSVDFTQKFKAKYDISRVEDAELEFALCDVFSGVINDFDNVVENLNGKLKDTEEKFSKLSADVENGEKNALIEKFELKLSDNKEFTELKNNISKYSKDEIETFCFAMIGKQFASESLKDDDSEHQHSAVVTHTAFSKDGNGDDGDGKTKKLYGGLLSVNIK